MDWQSINSIILGDYTLHHIVSSSAPTHANDLMVPYLLGNNIKDNYFDLINGHIKWYSVMGSYTSQRQVWPVAHQHISSTKRSEFQIPNPTCWWRKENKYGPLRRFWKTLRITVMVAIYAALSISYSLRKIMNSLIYSSLVSNSDLYYESR